MCDTVKMKPYSRSDNENFMDLKTTQNFKGKQKNFIYYKEIYNFCRTILFPTDILYDILYTTCRAVTSLCNIDVSF